MSYDELLKIGGKLTAQQFEIINFKIIKIFAFVICVFLWSVIWNVIHMVLVACAF